MLDLLIRNGTVIDGAGGAAYAADVAVENGRIVEIGAIPEAAQAAQTVDAAGLVVAPGFIDIHTHADIALLARPAHLPKIMQGVTTEVFTNCGLGFAPVTPEALQIQRRYIGGLFGVDAAVQPADGQDAPRGQDTMPGSDGAVDWTWSSVAEFLARFERQGVGANVVYLVPHGALRVSVLGMADRPADRSEVEEMRRMLAQAMEEGAWGMSTGVWYAPMRAADRHELVILTHQAGFFATHQRDYGTHIFEATEESIAIAREAGVPLQIAHLQMNGPENRGRAPEILALIERARAEGVDVTCDTYPYTAGSTFLQSLLPSWATDGGPEAILKRLADPDERARIVASLEASGNDWSRYRVVGTQSGVNTPYEGAFFTDAASARGLPVAQWLCAVMEEEELRACYVHHGAHEENVRTILQWPHQMVGSDGLHLPGKTHPRLYGTFPRVLGHYVRELRLLSLEEAVRKMTGAPAARLGLADRGVLRRGAAADIVLFDPRTVHDTATFEDPLRYPTGIPYVFVNGAAAKWNDQPTGVLAGKVLRKTRG